MNDYYICLTARGMFWSPNSTCQINHKIKTTIVVILHQKANYGMMKGIKHVSLIFSKQISLNKLLICFYNHIILEAVFHCQENFSG